MTRILVVGDTHVRQWDDTHPALREAIRDADIAIHCGDWVTMDAVEGFRAEARQAVVVHGNSDYTEVRRALPYRQMIEVDGVRIGVTHPAWAGPEPEPEALLHDFPPDEYGKLDIVAYGHIHVPLDLKRDGVHYINGGQGYPSFRVPGTIGWIETTPGGLFTIRIEVFAQHS
ncbi:MAG: metallophosphoesterase family protein [Chloroflexi bacterium]|nr:metallophosphoesterase family protein [Chloroflexota bacterium]